MNVLCLHESQRKSQSKEACELAALSALVLSMACGDLCPHLFTHQVSTRCSVWERQCCNRGVVLPLVPVSPHFKFFYKQIWKARQNEHIVLASSHVSWKSALGLRLTNCLWLKQCPCLDSRFLFTFKHGNTFVWVVNWNPALAGDLLLHDESHSNNTVSCECWGKITLCSNF